MADRLTGKVAIVTGAGRGIGRAEAVLLAAEGAAVVVNDLGSAPSGEGASTSPADEVVAEIKSRGGRAVANYDNVAGMQGGEAIVRTALDTFGRLDILVNNAGILRDRMIFNMTEEEWDSVIAVHLKGHFTTTRAASILFHQQRSGRIINTSSSAGLGNMGQANYSAAKEGIIGFTRTLARDLGRYGVTANAIRPVAASRLSLDDRLRQARERSRLAGIAGSERPVSPMTENLPEYVAALAVYLATDEASYINGRNFEVGGPMIGLYSEPGLVRRIYKPGSGWTLDELMTMMPATLGEGLHNKWPAQQPGQ